MVTMPESMSLERRRLLKAFGAEIVLTPAAEGMPGRRPPRPRRSSRTRPNAFMPQQFKNPANPEIHRKTTAEEIWRDTDGQVDILVSRRRHRRHDHRLRRGAQGAQAGRQGRRRRAGQLAGHHPDAASSEPLKPGPHKIQGIGAGFIPDILNVEVIDEVVQVRDDESFEMARRLAQEEGMLCGISCGAAAAGGRPGRQAARERRQADRRRPARPRRALPLDAALPRVTVPDDPTGLRTIPLAIPAAIRDAMVAHCLREAPLECCGLLGRRRARSSRRSTRCGTPRPARPATTPTRSDLIAAVVRPSAAGARRSWPSTTRTRDGRPIPSKTDLRENHYGDVPRIIVSLAGRRARRPRLAARPRLVRGTALEGPFIASPPRSRKSRSLLSAELGVPHLTWQPPLASWLIHSASHTDQRQGCPCSTSTLDSSRFN